MLGQLISVIQGLAPPVFVLVLVIVAGRSQGLLAKRAGSRILAWGTAAAVLAGAVLAVLRETTLLVNRELVSLVTLTALAVSLVALVVLTWLPALGRRWPKLTRIAELTWVPVATAVVAFSLFRALPAVFLQLTSFYLPGESPLTTDSLLRVLGFAAGWVLVALAVVVLVRATEPAPAVAVSAQSSAEGGSNTAADQTPAWASRPGVNRDIAERQLAKQRNRTSFWPRLVLTAGLAVAGATAALGLIQIGLARSLIKLPIDLFRAVAWGINHPELPLYLLGALALALPLARLPQNLRQNSRADRLGSNPAAVRLVRARSRRRLAYTLASAGVYAALGVFAVFGPIWDSREVELSPPEPFELVGQSVIVHLEDVDDGHLHRFAYTAADGTEVRFIVIKKNGVAYGVGLDACEVCGPTGYYERDGKIVCRLCDVVMNVATIGFKGGCNPIPLDHTIEGSDMVIQAADLEAAAEVFA
ncbi:MAG: DUF2318 domain-containing protein [Bifidobacteriaceae bacterium]|jgi:hypothetical protein|nr:DUF2318 domain-containing protein [Bifidobacteriaceae bacterium]